MVRPILEYASPVWDPITQKDSSELEKVQRRAARYVFNRYSDRNPGCVTDMLTTLNWEPLSERRINDRLTLLYKINNGIVDINKSQFYSAGDSRTRGAQRLFHERSSHPVLFNSFFPRTLRQWNKLDPKTTAAPSLESFQAGLRHDHGLASMTQWSCNYFVNSPCKYVNTFWELLGHPLPVSSTQNYTPLDSRRSTEPSPIPGRRRILFEVLLKPWIMLSFGIVINY